MNQILIQNLAKHLERSIMELAVIINFHHRRPHRRIELGPLDPKLDALTTRLQIHKLHAE